ncbi:MAG: hypothetical protein JNL98_02625 [Bryobacterales bacterium]|jgi:hypothetical protein|nr:hypothetical protein [Bryobacterales bacterium]
MNDPFVALLTLVAWIACTAFGAALIMTAIRAAIAAFALLLRRIFFGE